MLKFHRLIIRQRPLKIIFLLRFSLPPDDIQKDDIIKSNFPQWKQEIIFQEAFRIPPPNVNLFLDATTLHPQSRFKFCFARALRRGTVGWKLRNSQVLTSQCLQIFWVALLYCDGRINFIELRWSEYYFGRLITRWKCRCSRPRTFTCSFRTSSVSSPVKTVKLRLSDSCLYSRRLRQDRFGDCLLLLYANQLRHCELVLHHQRLAGRLGRTCSEEV